MRRNQCSTPLLFPTLSRHRFPRFAHLTSADLSELRHRPRGGGRVRSRPLCGASHSDPKRLVSVKRSGTAVGCTADTRRARLDVPKRLRVHVAQFAGEMAQGRYGRVRRSERQRHRQNGNRHHHRHVMRRVGKPCRRIWRGNDRSCAAHDPLTRLELSNGVARAGDLPVATGWDLSCACAMRRMCIS